MYIVNYVVRLHGKFLKFLWKLLIVTFTYLNLNPNKTNLFSFYKQFKTLFSNLVLKTLSFLEISNKVEKEINRHTTT